MELLLKRGTEYTPIIFLNPTLQNKKYCKIVEEDTIRCTNDELLNINLNTDNLKISRLRSDRQRIHPYRIPGGIRLNTSPYKLLALVVYKDNPENKFVIVNKEFFEANPSYLGKVKKSMNDREISSRTKLLIWTNNEINNQFQSIINPTMEDYSNEVQEQLSKEFIQSELVKYPIPVYIPNLKVEDKFEVGDYITITKSNKNWSSPMNDFVGKIVQITAVSTLSRIVTFQEDDYWTWNYEHGHFRHATQEEINNHLGIPEPLTTNVEFEEDLPFN